jgi:hypothetical protein
MADVTIDITIGLVSYKTWLTTSYIATALVGEGGTPLITNNELGPDQEDAFSNFIDEAAREVLKVFLSRQGNVTGVPFEKSATNAIYRFKEETPVLPQAAAIKNSLTEDVKNALFTYVTFLWLKIKKNETQATFIAERYQKITKNIDNHLYKLHD